MQVDERLPRKCTSAAALVDDNRPSYSSSFLPCAKSLGVTAVIRVIFLTPNLPRPFPQVDAVGTLNTLEAIRQAGLEKTCKYYQVTPYRLKTPSQPRRER
jgi:hypothetical protein